MKVLRGKRFADVEKVKQKMAKALKGTKFDKFKNCLEQWEKCLQYFEGDRSLNM